MDTGKGCKVVNDLHELETALRENDRVIAMVYASWCPFCRKVLPVFEKLAKDGARHFLLVADDEEHIADLYGIDVFPTLILFEKNQIVKRLDAKPGVGLNEKEIHDFIASCPLL
jgi:thiol-disulfide isomerase/thioredoxin